MKIAILGAGALGSVVGAWLAQGGTDVELWDIDKEHVGAIREGGLIFDGPDGRQTIEIPALHPEAAGDVDVIILLTKTLHTEAALVAVSRQIGNGALVLSLQNGLGNAGRVSQLVPQDQVYYGCTMMPGRLIAPGHVASPAKGSAVFRALNPIGEAECERISAAMKGFELRHDPDGADRIIWQKAAFNCAMNVICALQGGKVGYLAASPDGVELGRTIAAEVIDIAKGVGIDADLTAVYAQMDKAIAEHREHKPSMLQDMEAGRETEISSLSGEVARLAQKNGLKAPLNKAMATLIELKTSVVKDQMA